MSQPGQANQEASYAPGAAFLSYLIPGLGQIIQGRISKGVLFMAALLGLFHVGEAMGNWQNVYIPKDDNDGQRNINPLRNIINQRWHFGGQVWIGIAAWPAIWQYFSEESAAKYVRNYQKQPDEFEVARHWVNSDKTPDLGWIYTVIAGMLNILVIYDAFAGPAYGPSMMRDNKVKPPTGEAAES